MRVSCPSHSSYTVTGLNQGVTFPLHSLQLVHTKRLQWKCLQALFAFLQVSHISHKYPPKHFQDKYFFILLAYLNMYQPANFLRYYVSTPFLQSAVANSPSIFPYVLMNPHQNKSYLKSCLKFQLLFRQINSGFNDTLADRHPPSPQRHSLLLLHVYWEASKQLNKVA